MFWIMSSGRGESLCYLCFESKPPNLQIDRPGAVDASTGDGQHRR